MIHIDQYAYANRLRAVHPGEKLAFAAITAGICLASPSLIGQLAILMTMAAATVAIVGIPWRFYLKLMLVPAAFLLAGIVTVAVSFSSQPDPGLHGIDLWGFAVGIRDRDFVVASSLVARSLGTVSCLYFLSLSTPMVEIIGVLKRCRVPAVLVELMTIIYRFIFVLMETTRQIHTAQVSRLGYHSLSASYRDLGQLTSCLFHRSMLKSRMLFVTLSSRCYSGEIRVLEPRRRLSLRRGLLIGGIDAVLLAVALATRGWQRW